MSDLFSTGIRPKVDEYLLELAKGRRDYGEYWSASSAGYCMRKTIFDRLQVPLVNDDARKQRIFSSGHVFHAWLQGITKETGLSIAQEIELINKELLVKGHFDDLVLIDPNIAWDKVDPFDGEEAPPTEDKLILYDYKTQNSKSFATYAKRPSYYHKMQLGTYMYMLRKYPVQTNPIGLEHAPGLRNLSEARILKISKDDLRLAEVQYMWSDELKTEVLDYWDTLNKYWQNRTLPPCACADHENGFLAKEQWNQYFYEGEPCSVKWFAKYPECKTKWEELTNGRD